MIINAILAAATTINLLVYFTLAFICFIFVNDSDGTDEKNLTVSIVWPIYLIIVILYAVKKVKE